MTTDTVFNKNILIFGDDETYQRALARTLSRAQYAVQTTSQWNHVERLLDEQAIALLIYDMRKPYRGGLETLKRIVATSEEARVLVLTTFMEKSLTEQIKTMGAFDCLTKPAKRTTILDAVLRAMH